MPVQKKTGILPHTKKTLTESRRPSRFGPSTKHTVPFEAPASLAATVDRDLRSEQVCPTPGDSGHLLSFFPLDGSQIDLESSAGA